MISSGAPIVLGLALGAGCGPSGPSSLEGFGSPGETEGEIPGDGDGDGPSPGDGDGDPSPGDCIDVDLGAVPEAFFEGFIDPQTSDDLDSVCAAEGGRDHAYTWQAPFSGEFALVVESDWEDVSVEVREGVCEGPSQGCSSFSFPNVVEFEAVAGTTYTFIIESPFEETWYFLNLYSIGDPVPGDCPDGELFGTETSISGSTVGASNQFGSPCGGQDAPDRAYVFFPEVSGVYSIDTFGSDYDTMLYVLPEYCGGPSIECNDDWSETTSRIDVELEAGQPYTIIVDGWGPSAGNFNLNVSLVGDAPGLCDGIEVLPSVAPVESSWELGVVDGEAVDVCSPLPFERRHRWDAPETGTYRASFDTPGLARTLGVIPDGCDADVAPMPICSGAIDQPVIVEFNVTAGQELLFVSEWELIEPGLFANLTIDLVDGPSPPGPGCGIDLGGEVPVADQGTTAGPGNQHNGSCSVNPVPEVEYSWTAPETASYLISLEGSDYDTLLYVRDGGCNGPELACIDDILVGDQWVLWSAVELDLVAGQTISIFVDGYNGTGDYLLAIEQL